MLQGLSCREGPPASLSSTSLSQKGKREFRYLDGEGLCPWAPKWSLNRSHEEDNKKKFRPRYFCLWLLRFCFLPGRGREGDAGPAQTRASRHPRSISSPHLPPGAAEGPRGLISGDSSDLCCSYLF